MRGGLLCPHFPPFLSLFFYSSYSSFPHYRRRATIATSTSSSSFSFPFLICLPFSSLSPSTSFSNSSNHHHWHPLPLYHQHSSTSPARHHVNAYLLPPHLHFLHHHLLLLLLLLLLFFSSYSPYFLLIFFQLISPLNIQKTPSNGREICRLNCWQIYRENETIDNCNDIHIYDNINFDIHIYDNIKYHELIVI